MALGEPLASGRDADVFPVGSDRVLRRYRDGGDVTAEAALMIYLAGCGYPVPTIYDAGGADIVMDRIEGPTMLGAMAARDIDEHSAGEMLAGLHNQLHRLPAQISNDPATRVLHLDLHPDNVMLSSNGPIVIDWRNAIEGPPELDIALTAVILAQVAVGNDRKTTAIRDLLAAFLTTADADPTRMLNEALAMRGKDRNLTSQEVAVLASAGDFVRSHAAPTVAPPE